MLSLYKISYKNMLMSFADKAYPNRIHMADLPVHAELLFNPINNMSGFSLQKRYYFVPGFPSMAHPMIQTVIKKNYEQSTQKYRLTLYAHTSEDSLVSLMQKLPPYIELSSLPLFVDKQAHVELSLASEDKEELSYYFSLFTNELTEQEIKYKLI